jgi:hypothetical protein
VEPGAVPQTMLLFGIARFLKMKIFETVLNFSSSHWRHFKSQKPEKVRSKSVSHFFPLETGVGGARILLYQTGAAYTELLRDTVGQHPSDQKVFR